ncbi:MAG: hypothetical protein R3C01_00430 [Planctomycetaceae bacterium]
MIELVDQAGVIRIGTALHEAVINAMEHGNLQVSSELRESDDFEAYRRLVDERRQMTPYRDRRVHVSARFTLNRQRLSFATKARDSIHRRYPTLAILPTSNDAADVASTSFAPSWTKSLSERMGPKSP